MENVIVLINVLKYSVKNIQIKYMIIDKTNDNKISKYDIIFLEKACNTLDIKKKIYLYCDNLIAKHPDIWVKKKFNYYEIYVTKEWKKQSAKERRKRLAHELYHILGNNHWKEPIFFSIKKIVLIMNKKKLPIEFKKYITNKDKIKLLYSTYPNKDSFSWVIYYLLV